MSTPGFTYDPQTLERASRDLANGSAHVQSELSSLSSRIEPLHQAFRGEAGSGFQDLWRDWHVSAQKLRESLEALSQLLHGAATNAAQMEDANKRLMRKG